MKKSLLIFSVITFMSVMLVSCSKNSGTTEEQQQKKAEEFLNFIGNGQFRLTDFYSDKPIDYVTTDNVVKQETDLRSYIKPYLLDDDNFFADKGILTIAQNAQKIPGNNAAVINGSYLVSYDASHVYFDFVDHTYSPARYKVENFAAGKFTLYIDWPTGAKLYSRFESNN